MTTPETSGLITCDACNEQIGEELTVIDGNWEAGGEHPQIIFFHRCPLCQAEWRSIRDLIFKPNPLKISPDHFDTDAQKEER